MADSRFGRLVDGEWDGMVGELVRNKADIALGPLSITHEVSASLFVLLGMSGVIKK